MSYVKPYPGHLDGHANASVHPMTSATDASRVRACRTPSPQQSHQQAGAAEPCACCSQHPQGNCTRCGGRPTDSRQRRANSRRVAALDRELRTETGNLRRAVDSIGDVVRAVGPALELEAKKRSDAEVRLRAQTRAGLAELSAQMIDRQEARFAEVCKDLATKAAASRTGPRLGTLEGEVADLKESVARLQGSTDELRQGASDFREELSRKLEMLRQWLADFAAEWGQQHTDLRNEVRNAQIDLREELRNSQGDLRNDMLREQQSVMRSELQDALGIALQGEWRDHVCRDVCGQLHDALRCELRRDLRAEVKGELRGEFESMFQQLLVDLDEVRATFVEFRSGTEEMRGYMAQQLADCTSSIDTRLRGMRVSQEEMLSAESDHRASEDARLKEDLSAQCTELREEFKMALGNAEAQMDVLQVEFLDERSGRESGEVGLLERLENHATALRSTARCNEHIVSEINDLAKANASTFDRLQSNLELFAESTSRSCCDGVRSEFHGEISRLSEQSEHTAAEISSVSYGLADHRGKMSASLASHERRRCEVDERFHNQLNELAATVAMEARRTATEQAAINDLRELVTEEAQGGRTLAAQLQHELHNLEQSMHCRLQEQANSMTCILEEQAVELAARSKVLESEISDCSTGLHGLRESVGSFMQEQSAMCSFVETEHRSRYELLRRDVSSLSRLVDTALEVDARDWDETAVRDSDQHSTSLHLRRDCSVSN